MRTTSWCNSVPRSNRLNWSVLIKESSARDLWGLKTALSKMPKIGVADEREHFCVPDYMLYHHAYLLPPTTSSACTSWLGQHEKSPGDLASFFKSKRCEAVQQLMTGQAQVQQGTVRAVHKHWVTLYAIKGLMPWHLDCAFWSTHHIIVFSLGSSRDI